MTTRSMRLKSENSALVSYRGDKDEFDAVSHKLQDATLPITSYYENDTMHYVYSHGKCDGNTARHLTQIIKGLIGLYKV